MVANGDHLKIIVEFKMLIKILSNLHPWTKFISLFSIENLFILNLSNDHHLLPFHLSESCKSLDNSKLRGFFHADT